MSDLDNPKVNGVRVIWLEGPIPAETDWVTFEKTRICMIEPFSNPCVEWEAMKWEKTNPRDLKRFNLAVVEHETYLALHRKYEKLLKEKECETLRKG